MGQEPGVLEGGGGKEGCRAPVVPSVNHHPDPPRAGPPTMVSPLNRGSAPECFRWRWTGRGPPGGREKGTFRRANTTAPPKSCPGCPPTSSVGCLPKGSRLLTHLSGDSSEAHGSPRLSLFKSSPSRLPRPYRGQREAELGCAVGVQGRWEQLS